MRCNNCYVPSTTIFSNVYIREVIKEEIISVSDTLKGDSAYEVAVKFGYTGNEEEWLTEQGATIEQINVTTGEAGTDASVVLNGTPKNRIIDLTIPKGDKGEQGIQGEKGDKGDRGLDGRDGSYVQKAYKTYAGMIADKDSIPIDTSVVVNNDPDKSNNAFYTYDGTEFTKSDFDPQGILTTVDVRLNQAVESASDYFQSQVADTIATSIDNSTVAYTDAINITKAQVVADAKTATESALDTAVTDLFENGGLPATPFKTKALMTASALVDDDYAFVSDDSVAANNGLYVKTAGTWVKSSYDPTMLANTYTDNKVKSVTNNFKTKALMADSLLPDGSYAMVTEDTEANNGRYSKVGEDWVKSSYDPLTQAKAYTDTNKADTLSKVQNTFDTKALMTASPLPEGSKAFVGSDTEEGNNGFYKKTDGTWVKSNYDITAIASNLIGAHEESVKEIVEVTDSPSLLEVKDNKGEVVLSLSSDANLYIIGNDKSIQQQFAKQANENVLLRALNKTQTLEAPATLSQAYEDSIGDDPLFKLYIVDTVEDGDAQKYPRIASVLPLADNKLLYMWGRSIGAPWNGDAEGVRLYKRILTYDDTYNIVDYGAEELFDYAAEPASATKHVMMGRTKTGRIVIMYDKRSTPWDWEVPNNNIPETTIAFSDDEGVSFTEPVAVPNNSSYGTRYMGTSGNIVTLSTGRLVCPTYYASSQGVGLMYSDDDGQNWQESNNTLTISRGALQEPALAVDSEDNLYISSRHSEPLDPDVQMIKHSSKSIDGGETLIDLGYNNDIISPKVASSMYYDKDKKIMIHTSPYIAGRTDLRIYLSGDRGEAWKIYNSPTESGYPMGYTHVTKLNDEVYVMACEKLRDPESGSIKNVGVAFFNLSLIFNNVNDNQGV